MPGTYRRAAGTVSVAGPMRKPPALRSSIDPNTLSESIRGRHIHSMLPLGATSAVVSQSDRKAYSAIGGNGLPAACLSVLGPKPMTRLLCCRLG